MGSRTKLGIGIGILALGLCVAGCTAPQSDVEKPAEVKEETGGVRTLTLEFEAPTRARLAGDEVTPLWEAGDDIWLSSMDGGDEIVTLEAGDITELEGGANCATIRTELTGTLYAVYPSSAVVYPSEAVTDDGIVLRLPSKTDGSFAKAHMAVSKSEGDKMFFRNAVSILEFEEVDERVKSIEMSYSGRCSTYDVTIGDKLEFSNYNSTGSEMIKVTEMTAGKPVYLPVVPGAKIPAEAVFTFRDAKGSVLRRMTHSSALTPEVSWIYALGAAGPAAVPAGAVSGAFSDSRQVFFAEANLQSSRVFASGQTDYGGLFTEAEEFCIWRPITAEELNYLFSGRTSAAGTAPTIAGTANAIYLKCTVESVCGLLLFPDAFEWPSGIVDSKASCTNDWEADFSSATFDSDEFATLEAAGCVFLPAAGFSSSGKVCNAGSQGYYLTSTDVVLSFHARDLSYTGANEDPTIAQSLRLVTDAF